MQIIIILVFLVLVPIYYVLKWRARRWKIYKLAEQIKGVPGWPLIGNALEFSVPQEKLLDNILSLTERSGGTPFKFWLGTRLCVVFSDANHLEKILTSQQMSYKDKLYRVMEPYIGKGLISITGGHTWRIHRKLISPLYSQRYLENYLQIFEENTKIFVDKLRNKADGEKLDIHKYLDFCLTDIVFETLLGKKLNSQINVTSEFVQAIHRAYELIFQRFLKIWMHNDFLFKLSSEGKELMKLYGVIVKYIQEAIDEMKEDIVFRRKNPNINRSKEAEAQKFVSSLEMILKAMEEDKTLYSEEELIYEIITLYTASQDTTTEISSFIAILLGAYPEIQDQVYHEVKAIRGNCETPVTYSEIGQMKFLDMVIKEATRLFPIGPYILRQCFEDFKLNESITIPPDVSVIIAINDLHRQTEHWERPNDFYPEHFLPEKVAARHPYAFLPFSAGFRSCVGKLYATTAIKVVITGLVMNYRIIADRKLKNIPLKSDISIRSAVGYKLKLIPRHH